MSQEKNQHPHTWEDFRDAFYRKGLKIEGDFSNYPRYTLDVLPELSEMTQALMREWEDAFLAELSSITNNKEIINFLTSNNRHLPSFTLIPPQQGYNFINKERSLRQRRYPLERTSAILIFNLPKVFQRYWWKSKEATREMTIAWGYLYNVMMRVFWKYGDVLENGKGLPLYLSRISEKKRHVKNVYHYVWEVIPDPVKPWDNLKI